jgi:hypothetical protein
MIGFGCMLHAQQQADDQDGKTRHVRMLCRESTMYLPDVNWQPVRPENMAA